MVSIGIAGVGPVENPTPLPVHIYRTPKEIFPYLLLSPKFWWETKAPQMAKNWFQAYLKLDVPQMEKSDGNMYVFMCSQASDSSTDFS